MGDEIRIVVADDHPVVRGGLKFSISEDPDTKTTVASGAEGVPLTAQRSLAVDTTFTPFGTPIWIDTTRPVAGKPG